MAKLVSVDTFAQVKEEIYVPAKHTAGGIVWFSVAARLWVLVGLHPAIIIF
ncbi:hypothetical protein ES703_120637 [subsurface metagenome]